MLMDSMEVSGLDSFFSNRKKLSIEASTASSNVETMGNASKLYHIIPAFFLPK